MAVAFMDSLQLCHRDLKPENILLRQQTLLASSCAENPLKL